MTRKIALGIYIFLSGMLLSSCMEFQTVSPPPELDVRARFGEYIDTTFKATADTFLVEYKIDTKFSAKISIGSYKGFKAGFLIKFLKLADKENPMDSVTISLTPENVFGNQSGTLTMNIYAVEEDWNESANTEDFWHDPPAMQLVTTKVIDAQDTNKIVIAIEDTALIHKWQEEQEENNGLFIQIDGQDPGFIREFVSFRGVSAFDWPTLYYREKIDTVFVKDSTNIGMAATIFDYFPLPGEDVYEIARNTQNLVISSGIKARVLVKFDQILDIPSKVIIQAANITLHVNNESFLGIADSNEMANKTHSSYYHLRLVTEADDLLASMEVDSSFVTNSRYNLLLKQEGEEVRLDETEQVNFGTTYLQDIINGTKDYAWFQIQYQNENNDISVIRYFNRKTVTPTLRVRYYRVDHSGI